MTKTKPSKDAKRYNEGKTVEIARWRRRVDQEIVIELGPYRFGKIMSIWAWEKRPDGSLRRTDGIACDVKNVSRFADAFHKAQALLREVRELKAGGPNIRSAKKLSLPAAGPKRRSFANVGGE